ncbi:COX15/CtaA family protein [Pajaroellobacter abortibovis]|uniref:Cytochrome oxidase assembly protein n=1 Tax=Pajaroellobacter abortibovis TaxID=1882918 RepID=A0A1L6MUX0_9BACT|nr:COX15/CtaA family protein [Pajaroellobacter abortibovis]APR99308.1 hypothetical protein BCY86_00425 [Pajaroellobacter abortibovis]
MLQSIRSFTRLAWFTLAYHVLVILWGAFVRATGSGAGCGYHWPQCNGQLIPHTTVMSTWIEFGHRITSFVALVLVVWLTWSAFRVSSKGAPLRYGAVASLIFLIMEALIGAVLVLLELVAQNTSLKRGLSTFLHLINTFLLVASLALTAWLSSGNPPPRIQQNRTLAICIATGLLSALGVAATGSIAALGDTLFPSQMLTEGISADFLPTAHLFLRLRIYHPLWALLASGYLLALVLITHRKLSYPPLVPLGHSLIGCTILQAMLGFFNMALLAPIPLQLIHLLIANIMWILLVLWATRALAFPQ